MDEHMTYEAFVELVFQELRQNSEFDGWDDEKLRRGMMDNENVMKDGYDVIARERGMRSGLSYAYVNISMILA